MSIHIYHFTICKNVHKKNSSALTCIGSYSAFEEINSLLKKEGGKSTSAAWSRIHYQSTMRSVCCFETVQFILSRLSMQITIGNSGAFIHPSLLNMYLLPSALIFSSSEWNLCWGICCHNLYCHCSHSINRSEKPTNTQSFSSSIALGFWHN